MKYNGLWLDWSTTWVTWTWTGEMTDGFFLKTSSLIKKRYPFSSKYMRSIKLRSKRMKISFIMMSMRVWMPDPYRNLKRRLKLRLWSLSSLEKHKWRPGISLRCLESTIVKPYTSVSFAWTFLPTRMSWIGTWIDAKWDAHLEMKFTGTIGSQCLKLMEEPSKYIAKTFATLPKSSLITRPCSMTLSHFTFMFCASMTNSDITLLDTFQKRSKAPWTTYPASWLCLPVKGQAMASSWLNSLMNYLWKRGELELQKGLCQT